MGQPPNRTAHRDHANLVVLAGTVTNDPTRRMLRSGVEVMNFDINTPLGDERASVPLAWYHPSTASSFVAGDDVVVIGTVRRRFFRIGGQTQSRTEVVVDRIVPARRTKSVRSAVAAAAARLTPTDG